MKIKKFMSLLAATAMAVTALTGAMSVSASEVANGTCGDLTWTLDSDGVLTLSGEGEMATPDSSSIPNGKGEEAGGYADTYTYKKYAQNIKEVIIEEGVTTIGFCAFYKMPSIETVVIPSTVSKYIQIPYDSLESADNRYSYAFAECTSLKNLTLTEGTTVIGGYEFYGCTSLESVTIPSSISDWYFYSFYQCTSLKNITLKEGIKTIGAAAFAETAVESVVIPSTIEEWRQITTNNKALEIIGHAKCLAFANCKNLSSVTFKDGIKSISFSPFKDCTSLRKVFIPKSVTEMEYAFAYCTGLEEAYIEDGTQIISETASKLYFQSAFANCTKLKKLEIPEGVVLDYVDAQWCKGCSSLTDLYLHHKKLKYFPTGNDMSRIHCYSDTDAYTSAMGYHGEDRLAKLEEDLSKARNTLSKKLEEANAVNENDYTAESYAALKTAIDNAEKFDESYTGVLPLQWAAGDITSATRKLEKKPEPADYTAVDAALAKIPSDLSVYTDESVNALNDAKEAVVRDLTIDEQDRVNGFANAIEEAIAGLIKKQNSNTGSDNPQNPNQNTNKPNQPTSSKDKGKTSTNKVTVPKPAQVKSVKATAKKKKLNVSWKKVSGATGYEVIYATNNKFTKGKKIVKVKKNKVTLKKLKAKKKYFVKVRAYKKVKGNVSYGKWSKVVKKKVK